VHISRRSVTAAAMAAPFLIAAKEGPLRARVRVDTERRIGEIDPKIYGNFIEHLGRCIDGGVFDEGSALSDERGFRRDVLSAAKGLGVSQLRWPGGNFASNYHWMDGIGPRDERPRRLEMAWGTVETNRFGTHEFLDYTAALGAEPYVCMNMGTGSWTEAQQWVEYCNSSEDTAITRLRRKNGRDAPWKVKYWGLGNEMDGPWQMGHRSAADYGAYALEAAKLAKWTDPDVKLVIAGSSNYGPDADWIGWNRTVLQYLKDHADYLSLHRYVGNAANDFGDFLASSMELDDRIKTAKGLINAAMSTSPGRRMYIAFDEWNVWYRARGDSQRGRNILEERYNLEDALVVATFLNTFVRNADIVKMANMAQLVNVIAPIFTSKTGYFLQTIYYPLQLFAMNSHGASLELLVDTPRYKSKRFDDIPYLDVSAAHKDGALVLNVVNRHPDQAIETDIELADGQFTGPVSVSEVGGADLKATNDFERSPVLSRARSEASQGPRLRHTFPPHSYTALKTQITTTGKG
jgi:alpha-N-arabinofuranosidase